MHVLGAMHKERLAGVTTAKDSIKAKRLSNDKLALAIGLIQLISDTLQHHSDYELFAPDRNGILEFAANLTFDDAPWLNECDYETSLGSARFVHPKISNKVAAKIGCCSLRSQLLSGSETISLGREGDVEVFGQTEALTKRIAHILEQYPDGPNIISELIQNADDAGATRMCLLYNGCSYGTSSLLSPAMAKWQGPSLFCVRLTCCVEAAIILTMISFTYLYDSITMRSLVMGILLTSRALVKPANCNVQLLLDGSG